MRKLGKSARDAQRKAVKEGDTAAAIYESQVAAEYERRTAEHEKSGAEGW